MFVAGFLCVAGIAFLWASATQVEVKDGVNLGKALVGVLLLGLAAWTVLYIRARRIVLGPGSIESHGSLSHRTIARSAILGWRILPGHWVWIVEIIPREAGENRLLIQLFYETDSQFQDWFSSLPYLGNHDSGKP